MTYYAQRKSILNGEPQTVNNRYGTRKEMEYQFYLYCANAVKNDVGYEVDAVEWGTVEQDALERKRWINEVEPAQQVEPEEENP